MKTVFVLFFSIALALTVGSIAADVINSFFSSINIF